MTQEEEIKNILIQILASMRAHGSTEAEIIAYRNGFTTGAMWRQTFPHWFSVQDELPPRNVFVLTCDGQGNENMLMLAGDGRWYDKAVGLHRNITHWMPMPSVEHLRETTKMIEIKTQKNTQLNSFENHD